MKPIENIFGFDCVNCEHNRHCYGGNMGNQFKYCEKSAEKIQNLDNLEQENQKYKEVIDKIQKHCEIEINASNHYLKNHSSQKELCHKVAHQRILDILKEVE